MHTLYIELEHIMQSLNVSQTGQILIIVVGALICLDILSGLLKAINEKTVNSSILRQGLYHKTAYILLIATGFILQAAQQYVDLGYTVPIITAICTYIIITEVTSIIENIATIAPELQNAPILKIFDTNKISTENNESAEEKITIPQQPVETVSAVQNIIPDTETTQTVTNTTYDDNIPTAQTDNASTTSLTTSVAQ